MQLGRLTGSRCGIWKWGGFGEHLRGAFLVLYFPTVTWLVVGRARFDFRATLLVLPFQLWGSLGRGIAIGRGPGGARRKSLSHRAKYRREKELEPAFGESCLGPGAENGWGWCGFQRQGDSPPPQGKGNTKRKLTWASRDMGSENWPHSSLPEVLLLPLPVSCTPQPWVCLSPP